MTLRSFPGDTELMNPPIQATVSVVPFVQLLGIAIAGPVIVAILIAALLVWYDRRRG